MKENGVNISKGHERNDADSRDIVCVIFAIIMVQIITKYDIMRNKQIGICSDTITRLCLYRYIEPKGDVHYE